MKRFVAAIAIATATLASCGGADAAPRPRTTSGGPITTTAPPPLDGTNFVLDQHFWHDGFRVVLEDAEVWTSQTRFTNRISYWLTLRGQFENLGEEPAFFDPEMSILFDGLALSTRQGPAPGANPGSTAPGELTFLVTDDFEYQRAELIVGDVEENKARVPLGPEGSAVRLEPTAAPISGNAETELLDIALTGAELRYDDPLTHSTVAEGEALLIVRFDVVSRMEGRGRLAAADFSLVLPDGSSIEPAGAALGAVPGTAEGTKTEGLTARFIIDATATGMHTLRVVAGDWTDGDSAAIEIEFGL